MRTINMRKSRKDKRMKESNGKTERIEEKIMTKKGKTVKDNNER